MPPSICTFLTLVSTMEQAICFTYARSADWGIRTDSRVRPIWMMKDTPVGVESDEGTPAPPGNCMSITESPIWAGIEGLCMGVSWCIPVDPGVEGSTGWKKTWDIGPEGTQGLALAIQRESTGLWAAGCLKLLSTDKHTLTQVQCTVLKEATSTQTERKGAPRFRAESFFPLTLRSAPFQWIIGKKSWSRK